MKKKTQIAIDGPVAAGKGTIAAILAKKLKILYIYTGAMYRALAFLANQERVDLKDEEQLLKLLKKSKMSFRKVEVDNPLGYSIFLNGEDITQKIRTSEFAWGASVVGVLPKIRKVMVEKQQALAGGKAVIMEGRDITTKVLPQASLKIYLTANQETRAKRRQKQLFQELRIKKSFNEILKETKTRDQQDTQRKVDSLTIVPDAWVIDTTNLSIDQVVARIWRRLKEQKII